MASYDKPEVVERDVKDKEHEEDDKPIVVERDVKDKEHKKDDKPIVVERDVKDKEHKKDDKEEGKGGFLEKVKDFIHDIGEKIEGAIGFGKPNADVTGLHVNSINLEKAEFVIEILKKNPNPVPIPLIDINYLIESDGRKLISGLIPDAGTIKAHGEETIKIPVTLIYDDIKNTYADIKPRSIIPYRIKVDLLVDVPVFGRITLPLEKTGEIPIPYKPDIDIEKIKFDRFSFEETVAVLHLKLENKNDFDLGLNDLDYEVWLGEGTGYSMKGNINVDTPFGSIKLPITKEGGTTRIKKNKEDGGDDDDDDDEEASSFHVLVKKMVDLLGVRGYRNRGDIGRSGHISSCGLFISSGQ
uniref:Water stress and hypersensitive response domain-containing protein n=1 Tax=Quercus lobata TaxID=97700 RepID=A0A7N2MTT0_QUELO